MMHWVMTGNHNMPHHWAGPLSLLSTWWSPTETCPTSVAFKAIKVPHSKGYVIPVIKKSYSDMQSSQQQVTSLCWAPVSVSVFLRVSPWPLLQDAQWTSCQQWWGNPWHPQPRRAEGDIDARKPHTVSVCLCYPCFPFLSFDFSNEHTYTKGEFMVEASHLFFILNVLGWLTLVNKII